MHWLALSAAILFEVGGTTSMKVASSNNAWLPWTLVFVFYGISFVLLVQALKVVEVGTAYAIWSGIGTALIALIGILWFAEALTWTKSISIALIITGVVGLNLGGAA
jgi:small multidrug resistance pump